MLCFTRLIGRAHQDRVERLIFGGDAAGGGRREKPRLSAELRPTCAGASHLIASAIS